VLGEYDAAGALTSEYVWLGDVPVAVIKPNASTQGGIAAGTSKVYLIQPDHLDTPRVIVNASNQEVWRWDSAPFGDTSANEQPTGSLAAFQFNLRFPGQQFDLESASHYNYFRDYEAGTGRYLQSDPIGLEGGLDAFSYVGGDPIASFDLEGFKKRGPKPGLAGPHNQTIRKIATCIKKAGGTITGGGKQGIRGDLIPEEMVLIPPGGIRNTRRPDISFSGAGCIGKCFANVGRNGRSGSPVPREVGAMSDLRGTGRRGGFVPYNDPGALTTLLKNLCKPGGFKGFCK